MQYEKFIKPQLHAESVNTIIALGAHVWRMQVLNQGYFLPLSDAVHATVDTLTLPWAHHLYPTLDHAVDIQLLHTHRQLHMRVTGVVHGIFLSVQDLHSDAFLCQPEKKATSTTLETNQECQVIALY